MRPAVFRGRRYPSRAELARVLAITTGAAVETCRTQLSRTDGDGEAVVRMVQRRRFAFDGQVFRTRLDLARHIAPLTGGRSAGTLRNWLAWHHDDVAAVLAHAATARWKPGGKNRASGKHLVGRTGGCSIPAGS